ncbi:ice-binding family protein [Polaribacter glomeratus]|nr:ice-binding family protein [Polaribacter glomeratus]
MGILSTFEAYTGAGAITNDGAMVGDAGTNDGIVSGLGFGLGYIGTTYQNNPTTVQARIDLLRVYIHLSDVFVKYPGSHAPAFGGAETLYPGAYSIPGAGSLSGPITLDGQGDPNAYFILKFDGAFTVGVGTQINLIGGTRAANVFWISEGAMSIGASSHLKGTFIAHPGALTVGLNCTVNGRLLSTEGALTVGAGTVAAMPLGLSTIPIKCSGNCDPATAVDVLRSLKQYALFTSNGAVANSATSGIVGNIGTNSGTITGFTTSTHVGSFNLPSATTAQAVTDLNYAYIQLKLLTNTELGHLPAFGNGETVLPGVYYTGGAGSLAGTITLDAQGDSDAIFVFKFNGAFSVAGQSKVILKNGARRCNVFWTSEGATDIGTFSHMKGTFIAHAGAATMAANGNLEGRLLSTAGAIGFSTGVIYNDTLCFGDDTPISDGDQTVCSDGTNTQTLTASATSNTTAGNIVWYDAPTDGNAVSPATQVGIGSITYYAASYNGTYYSPNRAAVTLTINDCSIDTDGDGTPDSTDTDDDGDGINDFDEALIGTNPLIVDTDGNGINDGDADFDGDGIDNATESDATLATVTDTNPVDGNPDITFGTDTDSDGIPDATDTDDDGDGINDTDEALIGTNPLIVDTDGDGTLDGAEDFDGDGIDNATESDENATISTDTTPADGNPDITFGTDTDGDGIPDATDTDDDGDGINDTDEALIGTNPLIVDTDGDGTPDGAEDFDNDGIDNASESDENAAIITDTTPADGNPDITFGIDTDGDGTDDNNDTDDDGDGINDADEALIGTNPLLFDTDGDGNSDGVDDFDGDEIDNATESDENSPIITDTTPVDGNPDITYVLDTDNDGTPDYLDTDDDGDGINDADEALIGTNPLIVDTDGDGTPDGAEDFDGDGIDNATESDENSPIITDTTPADGNPDITFGIDTDGDGTDDKNDTDDDGDGINDSDEALIGTNPLLFDTDGDGNSDGVDDFDGDGLDNATESDENAAIITDTVPTDGNPDITFAQNTPPSGVLYNPTAPAECFNVFIENSITLTNGNTTGSLAAGGDLNLNGNYTVASQDCGCYDVNGNKIGLLVGGKVVYSGNNILSISHGSQYAKIGESNGSNTWYQDPSNAPASIRVTPGSNYSSSSHIQLQGNAAAFNASTNNNPVFEQGLLDFSLAFQRLRTNAISLSKATNNVLLKDNNGTSISNTNLPSIVKINLQNGINYLNITGTDLNNVDTFIYNQQPSASKTVVININAAGTFNWDVWQQNNVGLTQGKFILYNFYNTSNLQIIGNKVIAGTVLAPFANINKTVNTNNILGQIIGLSLNHNGGQVQCAVFTSNIASPASSETSPTASFTIQNDELCFNDNQFNFTNTSNTSAAYQPVNPISYSWNFGDGTSSILMNPTKSYSSAGTYNIELTATNIFGSDTQTKQVIVISSPNHPVTTKATLTSSPGTVTREITLVNSSYFDSWDWSITGGASGLYPNQDVVSFNFTAAATYEIIVTGYKDGCSEARSITFVIPSSEVTGGNGGGVESESLGDAISKIYVNRKKNSVPTNFVKSNKNLYNKAALKRAQPYLGKSADLTMLDMFPTELIAGDVANVTSPTDILDYTVADEVLAVDFSVNGKTKGVVLGIRTTDKIYNHTKASCDRLRGAEILNIKTVQLDGYNFLMQGIEQRNGVIEYAISFAVAKNKNDTNYTIQTNWYVNHYTKFNDVFNFQVWASNPADTQKLVTDILANLIASIPVNQSEIQTVPTTFAAKISREASDLIIKLKSTSKGKNIEISLVEIYSESTSKVRYRYNPLNTELEQTLKIDISDGYEYDGLITADGKIQDAFYHADGNWGLDYDKQYTTVQEYTVSNNFDREYNQDEHAIHRDVQIKAVSAEYDYLSIYKSLLPGNLSADYTEYKYLSFTAKGSGLIELGLLKPSVEEWKEQYRVMVDLPNEEQTYYIPFDVFTSTGTSDKITANDLTHIYFTFLPVEADTPDLDLTIKDVKFTKTATSGSLGVITELKNNFIIYPNPTNGNVKVILFSDAFTKATVSLYDVTGKEIYSAPVQLTSGKNEIGFNLKVKPGILFLKVNSKQTNYGTSKIIFR